MKKASIRPVAHEDMGKDRRSPSCARCKALAPKTDTNFTLISSQHGWRLTFEHQDGRRIPIWRCPTCWKDYKAKNGDRDSSKPASNPAPKSGQKEGLVARLLSRTGGESRQAS